MSAALTARLLGAVLLSAAGALLGHSRLAAMRRRTALLREIGEGLGRMADELRVLLTPLPEIFERLRDRPFFCLLYAGWGLEPADALWRRAADAQELTARERETLASLAAVIGRYDAPRQAAEIGLRRAELTAAAERLEAEIAARGRNYTGLGAALGAILAVVLF